MVFSRFPLRDFKLRTPQQTGSTIGMSVNFLAAIKSVMFLYTLNPIAYVQATAVA